MNLSFLPASISRFITIRTLLLTAPMTAAWTWLSTLITLLILWLVNGRPRYKNSSAEVAYISNIGAIYNWIFISGSAVTSVFFVITLLQFIIRHKRRANARSVPGQIFKARLWADLVALFLGIAAMTCLILLTLYDSLRYEDLHWILTLSFAFLTILCAIFNIIGISAFRHTGTPVKVSFILKLIFIILGTIALACMISFIYSCSSSGTLIGTCYNLRTAAASLEWTLGLLLFIFMTTWVIDFAIN